MKQREIIRYYDSIGGLRCKNLTLSEIKEIIKADFGKDQRVTKETCRLIKRTAEMYQRY